MTNAMPQFDVICDPMDRWIVWDHVAESPASFGGQIQEGLDEREAHRLAQIMNEIHGRRTAATHVPARAAG
ncbi:hypothetical protein HGP14_15505 [Rhizobium sp. P32RR-XVIII]|uniref:hypothetical protein n=1 Tax=Rhizobium sp. P32RR-XVIII TaxID=2726738 RepID=UPI00145770CC|nr:hypothetical protein [Rhizobium sp. P32RR-XVIII]NLS04762.1 hypothetical protein [Rhizobium sp. P32RR-XVIII]